MAYRILGLAVTLALTVVPAHADSEWGVVLPDAGCAQSQSWVARVRGQSGVLDATVLAAHSPAVPLAPKEQGAAGARTIPGVGTVIGGYARTLVGAGCSAHAEAGGSALEVGVPHVAGPGVSLSPVGLRFDGFAVTATSVPGEGARFGGQIVNGVVTSLGRTVLTLPASLRANVGLRVPADPALPAIAQVVFNEQVSTAADGTPVSGATGSGWVNAARVTLLGPVAADVTIGHAAVIGAGPDGVLEFPCAEGAARCGR
ncbi:hypothetical protein [Herbidospora daliensis]|uniref:hypothetical protein n=1 Tax=Herbidospora daliensis TaxID=295585 RepID=UPI000785E55B|nr:hypothetical protein [Herbidospora daliensis]